MDKKAFDKFRKRLILFIAGVFIIQRSCVYFREHDEKNEIVFYELPAASQDINRSYIPSEKAENDAEKEENAAGSKDTVNEEKDAEIKNSGLININTASSEELQRLNGIGPALAGRIIDYRQTYGRFVTIEEIKEVKGIGDKTFEKIKDMICVN